MTRRWLKVSVIAMGAVVAAVALRGTQVARAFNPQPEPPASVAIGIVTGQTARLTVVSVSHLMGPLLPPNPCDMRLSLYDISGRLLARDEVSVPAGTGTYMDFDADRELPVGGRLQIFGAVEHDGPAGDRLRCNGSVKANLEVYDSRSGRTTVAAPVTTTFLPPGPAVPDI